MSLSDEQIKEAASVSPLKFLPPDLRIKRKGPRSWMAQCPFHDDRTPSMSITQGEDGRHRWKCHGCDEAGDTITLIQKTRNMTFVEAVNLAVVAAKNSPSAPQIECVYDYRDERGELLYQIVRYSPKSFKCRTPLANGEFCWRRPPRLVLYRLYEIIHDAPDLVWLVEGEKDCDAIAKRGGYATTWPFGATAWRKEYAAHLVGRNVVVVPDLDEVGKTAGRLAYEALEPVAAKFGHVLLSTGKDVSEYFAAGKSLPDLVSEIEWKEG